MNLTTLRRIVFSVLFGIAVTVMPFMVGSFMATMSGGVVKSYSSIWDAMLAPGFLVIEAFRGGRFPHDPLALLLALGLDIGFYAAIGFGVATVWGKFRGSRSD